MAMPIERTPDHVAQDIKDTVKLLNELISEAVVLGLRVDVQTYPTETGIGPSGTLLVTEVWKKVL